MMCQQQQQRSVSDVPLTAYTISHQRVNLHMTLHVGSAVS